MQRVRIGLTGLAGVFVLVLVAAALFRAVSNEPAVSTDVTGNVVVIDAGNSLASVTPKEPLAELGVAPGAAPDNEGSNTVNMAVPTEDPAAH